MGKGKSRKWDLSLETHEKKEVQKREAHKKAPLKKRTKVNTTSLNNLAALYYSQGRYTEAEPLYREAIKIATQVLGKNHPDSQTINRRFHRNDIAISDDRNR